MSRDFDFELNDILAEFGADPPAQEAERETSAPAVPEAEPVPPASASDLSVPVQTTIPEIIPEAPAPPPEAPTARPETAKTETKEVRGRQAPPEIPPYEEKPAAPPQDKPKKESFIKRLGFAVLSLIFAAISLAGLGWCVNNLHPETVSAQAVKAANSTDIVAKLDSSVNNAKADALSDIAYIRKHYTIPEGDPVAPAPNPACFGTLSIDRAEEVLDVIQKARDSGLLEGQDVIFDPTVEFYSDSTIQYYCDDTILTICWKQMINNTVCSCVEVKVADASQFRRKFVDDTFGSPVKLFATALAKSVNSVVAMNADFYMFRDFGIVAYQRQLFRFADTNYTGQYQKYNCVDTLFVDGSGRFHYFHRLEKSSWEELQQYIWDNDILFSIAFGPILIENGELQECTWYPAGEWNTGYSRAGLGWYDELHYFYMNVNHSPVSAARWTINDFGRCLYEMGLKEAYAFDGGQTGEIVFQGEPFNYIDFGSEREVSDIIYFATAIPESEVTT